MLVPSAVSLLLLSLISAPTQAKTWHSPRIHTHNRRCDATSSDSAWSKVGCFTDAPPPNRLLASKFVNFTGSLTVDSCTSKCESLGYSYAGVEFSSECYCANELSKNSDAGTATSDDECNMICDGDKSAFCGGGWHIEVYKASNAPSSASTLTKTVTTTHRDSATTTSHKMSTTTKATAHTPPATSSKYKIKDRYQGKTFFDGWSFFDNDDPTHGLVNYQSKTNAFSKGLAYVQDDGTAVMRVANGTISGSKRDSVRITSPNGYTKGLFILDLLAMPTGCSLWPSWWTNGDGQWPSHGEIDIIEGVNNNIVNQVSVHTATNSKCSISQDAVAVSGKLVNDKCPSKDGDNSGCGFQDSGKGAFGSAFNKAGGGVFAMLWDDTGIRVYRFPRSSIPSDITSQAPDPTKWGKPTAAFTTNTCDTNKYFSQHSMIFDITLCGDWAGSAFGGSGCGGSCSAAVKDPKNFQDAAWKIKSLAVYSVPS